MSESKEPMTAPPTTLVTIEFSGVGSNQKFGQLIPEERLADVHQVDPLKAHLDESLSLSEHAGRIVDSVSGPAQLVLGLCSSTALAVEVAARLGAAGEPPPVVLLDPYQVDEALVRREFATLFTNLGGEPEPVMEATQSIHGTELLESLEEALWTRRDFLVEMSGGEEAADMAIYLLKRYRAWVRFLAASAEAPRCENHGRVTAVARGVNVDLPGIIVRGELLSVEHFEKTEPEKSQEALRQLLLPAA